MWTWLVGICPNCAEFQEDHFWNEFSETSFGIWLLLLLWTEYNVRLALYWLKINQITDKDYFKTWTCVSRHWFSCLELGPDLRVRWRQGLQYGIFLNLSTKADYMGFRMGKKISRLGIIFCFLFPVLPLILIYFLFPSWWCTLMLLSVIYPI